VTPIVSLRFLTEPAYALVGAILPREEGSAEVRLLVSPGTVLAYPPQARPLLEYLSILRSESDVVDQVTHWGGAPDDLDGLVRDGCLIRLPAHDEEAVRAEVEGLALWVTAVAVAAPDGQSVLLRLPTDDAVAISPVTAAVLDAPDLRSLGFGVRDASAKTSMTQEHIWRHVLYDLTAILTTGTGSLLRVGAEP